MNFSLLQRPVFGARATAVALLGLGAVTAAFCAPMAQAQERVNPKALLQKPGVRSATGQLKKHGMGGREICPGLPRLQERRSAGTGRRTAEIPIYNSRSSAVPQIYLDLDGATVSSPEWTYYTSGRDIICPPIELTNAEIQYIFNTVKEDFSPFDINITTDPAKYNSAPIGKRMRVIVTSNDVTAPNAGGVAYLNSFSLAGEMYSADVPCFVFNPGAIGIAEAISHEVGHTLGLDHDGREFPNGDWEGYYLGHGTGVTSWAPIMGAAYYVNMGQWSKGEYLYANNKEDDLSIILGNNGLSYVADEAGNTIGTAKKLPASAGTVALSGLITGGGDVDVYSFTSGSGTIELSMKGVSTNQNLDCKLEILNSSGTPVATAAPDNDLNATLSATLAPGNYFVRLSGSGAPTPPATGYTRYGSIGEYTLTGTVPGLYLAARSASATEGNAGISPLQIPVTLAQASTGPVTFKYATSDESATAGEDYYPASGTATIPAGQITVNIPVIIIGDTTIEPNETFLLTISDATGAEIAVSTAQATILTDDIAPDPVGRVVFASDRDGNNEIYISTVGQTEATRLTFSFADDNSPVFSAASGRIAFISNMTGRPQLWTMSAAGDNYVQLTNFYDREPRNPCWAPDGRTVYFNDYRVENALVRTNLRSVSGLGGTVNTLTYDHISSAPAVSPDGTLVAYQSGQNPEMGQIRYVKAGSPFKILVAEAVGRNPTWTPDGTAVIYSRYFAHNDFDIARVELKSGASILLTESAENEDHPVCSPDGNYIAYERDNGDGSGPEIWRVEASGKLPVAVETLGANWHPSWATLTSRPEVVSLSPADATNSVGSARAFKAAYRDGDGVEDMAYVFIQIKGTGDTGSGLHAFYGVKANKLWLHDGKTWIGGIAPGTKKPIVVSQGSLNCGLVTVSKTFNTVTVNWNFTPSVRFTGVKNVSLRVTDSLGLEDGPRTLGKWTVKPQAAKSAAEASTAEEPPVAPSANSS